MRQAALKNILLHQTMIPVPSYIINLDSCPQHKERMLKECSKYFDKFEIFKAVDGRQLKEKPPKMKHFTLGILGNLLSHRAVIQMAKDKGLPEVIALEDDCEFNEERVKLWYYYLSDAPKDWGIISLGMFCYGEEFSHVSKHFVKPIKGCYGTHAYIIRQSHYDKFLEICDRKEAVLDQMLTMYAEEINYYFLMPSMIKQIDINYSYTSYAKVDFSQRFKYF